MIEGLKPPPHSGLIREARVLLELARLMVRFRDLARQPHGNGEPVLVLPGYGAGDITTALLQGYLRFLGYRVRGWGRGRNRGEVSQLLPHVLKRTASLARRTKQGVRLTGWSFGGYLAREIARDRPELVHQVITLGTPVVGGPKYIVLARRFNRRGFDLDRMAEEIALRTR